MVKKFIPVLIFMVASYALVSYAIVNSARNSIPERTTPYLQGPHLQEIDISDLLDRRPNAASVAGRYKTEEKEEECPVCYETKKVVKPFKCEHTLCEKCLDGIKKAHDTVDDHTLDTPWGALRFHNGIQMVCPLCRAELREPTQTQEAAH